MTNLDGSSISSRVWAEQSRRNPNDPYAWMMAHGSHAGRPFTPLPYLADIARDAHPMVVVQKAAQVGATELFVYVALHAADSGYAGRGNVLYLMHTEGAMHDFAQARVDRAIQDSPYLRGRLVPEPPKRRPADNTRLKRIGAGYVFMRGAQSQRQISSIAADIVIADEFDLMSDEVLGLAQRRVASSQAGRVILLSTPRYPEAGINRLFLNSDQRLYFIPCSACGLEQALTWDLNVDVQREVVVCRQCRRPMDTRAHGRWIAMKPGNARIHGYQLSRLYSPWANIPEMIEASTASTPAELQRFQNDDLGEAFMPPGGGLSLHELDAARGNYTLDEYDGQPCVMGVDVGTRLHVVVRELPDERSSDTRVRLWCARDADWEDLPSLWSHYNIQGCVIDAQPETRKATELGRSQHNVWLARYDRRDALHQPEEGQPRLYHLDRSAALDECFERFRTGRAELPRDARQLGGRPRDGVSEYYRQVMAPQRTLEQDATGNWVVRWLDHNRADHFAHAEVYCLFAQKVAHYGRFYDPQSEGPSWSAGRADAYLGAPSSQSSSASRSFLIGSPVEMDREADAERIVRDDEYGWRGEQWVNPL